MPPKTGGANHHHAPPSAAAVAHLAMPRMITSAIAINRLQKWLAAILLQGTRLSAAVQKGQHATLTHSIDAHFFVVAAANSRTWAKELLPLRLDLKATLETFISTLPEARDLRNMLEHDNEYLKGEGHMQSKHLKHAVLNAGRLSVTGISPQVVVVSDEGISIGGRLSVPAVMKAASLLVPFIE
jgi:hypothetical protein